MAVTLKTIAQKTGLSVTTVSRALKNGDNVKEPTKAIVKAAAKELGYAPNLQGLGLRTGINYNIAVILPLCKKSEIDKNLGNLNLLTGIISELEGTPYHVTVLPLLTAEDPLEKIIYAVESGIVGCVIFTHTLLRDPRVSFLTERNFPFVSFGQTEMGISHPYVDIDQYDLGYKGGKYLFENGCKNIRLFGPGLNFTGACHCYYGVRRAAMEYGVKFDDSMILPNADITLTRRKELAEILKKENPDGLFNGCDLGALVSLASIYDSGLETGKDIKVITAETSHIPTLFSTKITGLQMNYYAAGQKLAQFSIKRIEGAPVKEIQYSFKADLIER